MMFTKSTKSILTTTTKTQKRHHLLPRMYDKSTHTHHANQQPTHYYVHQKLHGKIVLISDGTLVSLECYSVYTYKNIMRNDYMKGK